MMTKTHVGSGFQNILERFIKISYSIECNQTRSDFKESSKTLAVRNQDKLIKCGNAAIYTAILTNKLAVATSCGVLTRSLANDSAHRLRMRNWLSTTLRGLPSDLIKPLMIIGILSSGIPRNKCSALTQAIDKGIKTLFMPILKPKIFRNNNTIVLNIDKFLAVEVLALFPLYQLIHMAGFSYPPIDSSRDREVSTDYTH